MHVRAHHHSELIMKPIPVLTVVEGPPLHCGPQKLSAVISCINNTQYITIETSAYICVW